MNHAAYALKRGDIYDPEDSRLGYRLHTAITMLASVGVEPTWEHADGFVNKRFEYGREYHGCSSECKATWPSWVTDEVFELAMQLANEIRTEKAKDARGGATFARSF